MVVFLAGAAALLLASPSGQVAAPTAALQGSFNVTMRASFSSCDGTPVGDVRVEQWSFDGSGSAIHVAVSGPLQGSTDSYTGELQHDGSVVLRAPGKGIRLRSAGTTLVGRRVHTNAVPKKGSCTVIYELKATPAT